jgi:hypothetical protein
MQPCRFRLFIAASNPAPAREGNLGHAENDRSCAACSRRRSRTIRVHWTCSFPPPQIHSPLRPCSVSHTPAGNAARPTEVPRPGFRYRSTRKLAFVSRHEIFPRPNPDRCSTLSPSKTGVRNSCSGFGNEPSRLQEGGGDVRRRRGCTREGGDAATSPAGRLHRRQSGCSKRRTATLRAAVPPHDSLYGDPSRRQPLRRPLRWSSSRR